MSIPFKKYGYELNPITNEYKQPQIFLVNKRIHRIGELYPVDNLKITVNEINQADEISFTYYRKVDGKDAPLFDKLDDLSIVLVEGYGYFEIAIEKNENSSVTKSVTGISLGHAELSQILTTLEINTDDDTNRNDYSENYPTIFYRSLNGVTDEEIKKKYRESSLLHRILSCAPHYRIGAVSKSLRQIQRTFSWSDTDILSIFNDISKEINCAFDIQIYLEDGKPQRIINVYDMQYCDKCYDSLDDKEKISSNTYKYRTIINGVCQNCGSSKHIIDIGMDTNIFISTENLSDDICIRGEKDSIKNCFKVTGGDDLITAAVQGLAMSASDRIMMFSDKQKQEMSPRLKECLDNYDKEYQENIGDYEKLLETEYNILDIKHYLRSSKMPPHEKEILKTDEALYTVLKKISDYYNNKFFIIYYDDYSHNAARISLQKMFSSFMPEGYSFSMEGSTITDKTNPYNPSIAYQWYGKIKIYSTGNRDDSYTLHLQPSQNTYITQGEIEEQYTFSDSSMQNVVNKFSIVFCFADKSKDGEYREYIEQHTQYILSTIDQSYDNEIKRPWNLYSYNQLESFYDGYERCIDSLMDLLCSEEKDTENYNIIMEMKTSYQSIQRDIQTQMDMLLEQIFAICAYHGQYDPDFLDEDGRVKYSLKYHNDLQTVFQNMLDPSYSGGYQGDQNKIYQVNKFIGTKPFQCKKCGSSNVSESTNGNICSNPRCESSDIYTYLDIMENIYNSYCSHRNAAITNMRETYQKKFNLENYLVDEQLYAELRSFIREDVYKNDNYISDGLNNTQLIEHAKELRAKAEQELAKACMAQYTIDAPLSSIVGQKSFLYQGIMVNDDYSGFRINNFVRVRIDGEVYKMRVASMELSFPVTDKIEVTFTNVTNFKGGTLNDVKDIIDKASSMATSYSYVATQAEKGSTASAQFDTIKKEGLDAALMAVKAGRDQDVVIDGHGILLRRKIQETDSYSRYQMKLIDRNLVMTDNNWESARLAIGLGMYNKEPVYGVWADLICGDLTVTKELHIKNDNNTIIIDENGITLDGGKITWTNPVEQNAVSGLTEDLKEINSNINTANVNMNIFKTAVSKAMGVTAITSDSIISPKIGGGYLYITNNEYSVEIDPNHDSDNTLNDCLFCIRKKTGSGDGRIMSVDTNGNGYFNGKIESKSGSIGGWNINSGSISYFSLTGGTISLNSFTGSIISESGGNKATFTSGYIGFERNSTKYMTLSCSCWKDNPNIYGVGILSEVDSKFISFGNKKSSSEDSYTTPLVLNYGLNPNDDTQDVIIYGTAKVTGNIDLSSNIKLNNGSYLGASSSGGAYFSSNIFTSGGVYPGNVYNSAYKLYVNGNSYFNGAVSLSQSVLTSSWNINFGFSTAAPDGNSCNAATVYWTKQTFESKSSDARVKEKFCALPDNIDMIFDSFDVQQYEYKPGLGREGKYFGETAQHIERILSDNGYEQKDYALVGMRNVDHDSGEDKYIDENDKFHYIDNSNIIWLCVDQIQKLKNKVKELEEEILISKKEGD